MGPIKPEDVLGYQEEERLRSKYKKSYFRNLTLL